MYVVWNEGKVVKEKVNVGFYDNGQCRGQSKSLFFYARYDCEPFSPWLVHTAGLSEGKISFLLCYKGGYK